MIKKMLNNEFLLIATKIAAIILIIELLIMYVLSFFEGQLSPTFEMLVDPFTLVLTSTPIITYYVILPYIRYRDKVEVTLSHLSEEALAANKAKSEFLAMMSHELRTPLNAIIGYSEFLSEQAEEDNFPISRELNQINSAGKHLLALINNILDLSKLEAGKTEVFKETFSLQDMVVNVASMVEALMKMNQNQLILEIDKNLGLMHSDFVKIRQNLLNLLSNAAKFTENGKIVLTVKVEPNDWILFSVQDSGCGITSEQLEKLFNPFIQADSSTTRKHGGTGLGLSLFKRYTELLDGTTSVESIPNQGSTFSMRLPRGDVDDILLSEA
ncbi:PAS domain response regulator [Candidatus Bealeia paramacronuclearis]|uniref:histidine kinase n=1 Tax=Candidatus Bealeia paramacronuclearis TaxID=1921001 RepID=A0ABZ2C166_9PROT|nr:PAS domain response regulator [Candidatus Bealeia paramacronuclearis]